MWYANEPPVAFQLWLKYDVMDFMETKSFKNKLKVTKPYATPIPLFSFY